MEEGTEGKLPGSEADGLASRWSQQSSPGLCNNRRKISAQHNTDPCVSPGLSNTSLQTRLIVECIHQHGLIGIIRNTTAGLRLSTALIMKATAASLSLSIVNEFIVINIFYLPSSSCFRTFSLKRAAVEKDYAQVSESVPV